MFHPKLLDCKELNAALGRGVTIDLSPASLPQHIAVPGITCAGDVKVDSGSGYSKPIRNGKARVFQRLPTLTTLIWKAELEFAFQRHAQITKLFVICQCDNSTQQVQGWPFANGPTNRQWLCCRRGNLPGKLLAAATPSLQHHSLESIRLRDGAKMRG